MKSRMRKRSRALLCLLLAWAMICTLCAERITVTASGAELTFDLGVNPESVTAVLDENGRLTVSGSGAIRDFTPETAPFAGLPVRSVHLGADLTALGSYVFYNCGELTAPLTLPAKLVRIGDGAFSGDSLDRAAKPAFVENLFTEAMVTKKKDESTAEGEEDTLYTVETISCQEIGSGIFFARADAPAFLCAQGNSAFREAMTAAGYREASQMLTVTLDNGTDGSAVAKSLPVIDGSLLLPELPAEFSAPQGGDIFEYSFAGWTESQDQPDQVRAAGSPFSVGDRTDLYFIAGWNRTVKAALKRERTEGGTRFTAPELPNYDVTGWRWQTALTPDGPWKELPNETKPQLTVKAGQEALYRCIVTGKAQQSLFQSLFSGSREEEIVFPAARSLDHTQSAVLTAVKGTQSKTATATATVSLPVSQGQNRYKITEVRTTGQFSLALPAGNDPAALPAFSGTQNAGNTFTLRAQPTGTGWTEEALTASAWLLTGLPEGEEAWNSGVTGVWKQGESEFVTGSESTESELLFTLSYDPSFQSFSGGTVELVLGELDGNDALQNKTTVTLTLEEQGSMTQTACTAAGRSFEASPGSGSATVTGGAVTAWFTSEYTPQSAGAAGMELCLYQADGTAAAFPGGTRVVLGDQTVPGGYRYYSFLCSGQKKLSLSGFSGKSGAFTGPAEAGVRRTEKLLFALDFGETALPQGSYYLTLSHQGDEAPAAKASFTVAAGSGASLLLEQGESVEGTLWKAVLTPQVGESDCRYEAGCFVALSLFREDGTVVSFPESAVLSGGESPVCGGNGASLYLPRSGGTIALDLSLTSESELPDGKYQLSAALSPRPGVQGTAVTAEAVSQRVQFTLVRGEGEAVRSLGVSLSGGQRLLEATGTDSLTLTVSYQNIQAGDRLEAELLQKQGESPEEASYTALGGAESWGAALPEEPAESGSGELTLTVPEGQPGGTYRVLVRIKDAAGNTVAEEPYNFIVKETLINESKN